VGHGRSRRYIVDIGRVERIIEIERIDETAPIQEPHVVPAGPEGVPA